MPCDAAAACPVLSWPCPALPACLQSIDPHLLLLIFLPTIGFSAALSQEPHLLRRNWGQVRVCTC